MRLRNQYAALLCDSIWKINKIKNFRFLRSFSLKLKCYFLSKVLFSQEASENKRKRESKKDERTLSEQEKEDLESTKKRCKTIRA